MTRREKSWDKSRDQGRDHDLFSGSGSGAHAPTRRERVARNGHDSDHARIDCHDYASAGSNSGSRPLSSSGTRATHAQASPAEDYVSNWQQSSVDMSPAASAGRPEADYSRLLRVARALLVVGLLGFMVWAFVKLTTPGSFPIKTVQVEGAMNHVTAEALRKTLADAARGGFLQVNVAAMRQAAERLPWVQSVRIRRMWPDALHVYIVEHQALARWAQQGLLSSTAAVFAPPLASYPPALPILQGPEGTQAMVLANYQGMSKTIAPLGLHIAELHLDERRSWRVTLDNGVVLVLGRDASDAHLHRFVRVYPTLRYAREGDVRQIDLRYHNGLAVRWQDWSVQTADATP